MRGAVVQDRFVIALTTAGSRVYSPPTAITAGTSAFTGLSLATVVPSA
jgi:hypothetical protein